MDKRAYIWVPIFWHHASCKSAGSCRRPSASPRGHGYVPRPLQQIHINGYGVQWGLVYARCVVLLLFAFRHFRTTKTCLSRAPGEHLYLFREPLVAFLFDRIAASPFTPENSVPVSPAKPPNAHCLNLSERAGAPAPYL